MMKTFRPRLEHLEGRSLCALIAILGTGTNPVGPLAGHVLVGKNIAHPGQPGNVDLINHDTATASIALAWDPSAKILPIVDVDATGIASGDAMAAAIHAAIRAKATVISISFSTLPISGGLGFDTSPVWPALYVAEKKNIPVIVAAGNAANNNDITPVFPSNDTRQFTNVVSVAAVDRTGALARFSNYGSTTVTLGALGVGVPATLNDGRHALVSGTSFATPEIAGLVARLRDVQPHAPARKIIAELEDWIVPSTIPVKDGGSILESPYV